jgi:RNA polymerase sigma factor (sigma-70 family)
MRSPLLFLNSDARILDGIRRGDESALLSLFESQRRPITALVLHNSGTPDDAEDVLQEALIVLWERVRTGKYEHRAALGTFIYATARNIWLRRLARARHEQPIDPSDDVVAADEPTALESMVEVERTECVEKALDLLGEPCRSLLVMFYWEEESMDAIARRLGFANAATAKSKKYQCKQQLGVLIKKAQGGHERN